MAVQASNVLLVTVDALRADHVGAYGYDRPTTPNLDSLAADGVRFTRASSASGHTRESIPALLSGRYPDRAIDADYRLAVDSVAALVDGVATAAIHSNPYVSRAYAFDAGFDHFDDDLYFGRHRMVALAQRLFDKLRHRHYAPADDIATRALSWLDGIDGPFFLWTHFMDPHGPYDPPREYQEQFHGDTTSGRRSTKLYRRAAVTDPDSISVAERRELLDFYDGEIAYADAVIGRFFERLRDRGDLDDTLVVLTADHGDAFGEHGYYGHPRELHDELLAVPLVLDGPGLGSATIDVPVSLLDVAPTILDVFDESDGDRPGVSLFGVRDDPGAYADRRVFAQARGTGEDASIRRFSLREAGVRYHLERDARSGQLLREEPGGDGPAPEALRTHSRERVSNAVTDSDMGGELAGGAVGSRLRALGYRE